MHAAGNDAPHAPKEMVGRVGGIALRSFKRGPMREIERTTITSAGGLDGDLDATRVRAVTFLASGQWGDVTRELAVDLPWHTRRANVLVECDTLLHLIGHEIRIGDARIRIHAETRPCELMDELHPGLRAALEPDGRGGVYGGVVEDGAIAVGDVVTLVV